MLQQEQLVKHQEGVHGIHVIDILKFLIRQSHQLLLYGMRNKFIYKWSRILSSVLIIGGINKNFSFNDIGVKIDSPEIKFYLANYNRVLSLQARTLNVIYSPG